VQVSEAVTATPDLPSARVSPQNLRAFVSVRLRACARARVRVDATQVCQQFALVTEIQLQKLDSVWEWVEFWQCFGSF
jgi:hypothetical protein